MKQIITILLLSIGLCTFAQVQKTIEGKVVDADNKTPIIGALVVVAQNGNGATTNENGYFIITDVNYTSVDVIVNYLGFVADTFRVNMPITTPLKFELKADVNALNAVEVTGILEGSIKAFIEQKKAENIKNVMSAEQIETFPDMNAAEVMQRIPGITLQRDQGDGKFVQLRGTPPELTTFNVNGEQIPSPQGGVRYVGMDIVAADQIDFIEVNKVLTPDMDGDGIAGSVNIRTKTAQKGPPKISATLSSGYGNIRATPNYQAQFSYGNRPNKFGFQLNASFFQNQQGTDNIEYKYAKGPFFGSQDLGVDNYKIQFREVQLRHYNVTRTRIGISPTVDYQFNKSNRIYLQAMYNEFEDYEIRRRKIYDLDDALSKTYYLYGGIAHDIKERTKNQSLSSGAIGGEHVLKFKNIEIDYQLFYAIAKEAEPDRVEAVFENAGQAIAIDFDLTNPDYPRVGFPNENNAGNATNFEAFEMDEFFTSNSSITDINITPRLNIKLPIKLFNATSGYIKTGGKIRMKNKERNVVVQNFGAYRTTSNLYPGEGPPLTLAALYDGFDEQNLLNNGYALTNMPSAERLTAFYERYPQFFVLDRLATSTGSFGEDYKAQERIYAGYVMIRQDFKKLMLIAGLRYEETRIEYEGRNILSNGRTLLGIDTLFDKRSHIFFLPQIQVKYAKNKNLNFRGALTQSYSRPNFDHVLPYRQEQDREEVQFGNPNLVYPLATNVDLLVEKYFAKGILSGGVFYKNIDDFVFLYKRFAHEGNPENFGLVEITTPVNGIKAEVYGAELQAQFKFDFLKGFWKRFGVYTNYTFTESAAVIGKRYPANYSDAVVEFGSDSISFFANDSETETVNLPGQAQHTANFALFYDYKRLFIQVNTNYQSAFLQELGGDSDLDEYYDFSFRLDVSANYQITKKLKAFVNANNLTNAPLRRYLGNKETIQQLEFYSWWMRGGIRLNF